MVISEKNRALSFLTVSNLKLDDVFSDVFGKSSRSIIAYILELPGEKFDVASFINKRCKHPLDEIQAVVDGAVSREQAAKLSECLQHIDEIGAHKKNIEREIFRLAEPYAYQLSLIQTVPGLSGNPMPVWRFFANAATSSRTISLLNRAELFFNTVFFSAVPAAGFLRFLLDYLSYYAVSNLSPSWWFLRRI